jgi:hypothetical protein
MSIDTLGRQASQELTARTADLDIDEALRGTLDQPRRQRRLGPALVVAAAVLVLLVGWSLSDHLLRTADSAPPADDSPSLESVGSQLGAPMSALAPSGWNVIHDGSYVEMTATDGSQARIVMVVPHTVYDPRSFQPTRLKDDPVVWMTLYPGLKSSARIGINATDYAWTGTQIDLSLSDKASTEPVPLVRLTGGSGAEQLSISADDEMFRWNVVYFEDSDPLAIAATSARADDPNLTRSIDELLASIQIQHQ